MGGILNKGIHHPEFQILDICRFKIAGKNLPHHTSPSRLRVVEQAGGVHTARQGTRIGIIVIGTLLSRVICNVKHR